MKKAKNMDKQNFKLVEVDNNNKDKYLSKFIDLYISAFSEPPYFEKYSRDWVIKNVWLPHLKYGKIILAVNSDDQVLGLSCCINVMQIPGDAKGNDGVKDFFIKNSLPFDLESTCYMSEIAVDKRFRRQGVGMALIQARINWAKNQNMNFYVMRTDSQNLNSINLYKKMGAKVIKDLIQDVSDLAAEVSSASTERIIIYGKIN